MGNKCRCCKRQQNDLRFGVCFDCANAESIIEDGTDMDNKEIKKKEGFSKSLSKLQHILNLYGITKTK